MNEERKIKNLEFAVDTCFPWMRQYYRNRLSDIKDKQLEQSTRSTNLKLCYKHRQEQNHSCYSEQNCHYCQIYEWLENLCERQAERLKELQEQQANER